MARKNALYRREVLSYGEVLTTEEGVIANGATVRERDGSLHQANLVQVGRYPYQFDQPNLGLPRKAGYQTSGGKKQYRGHARRTENVEAIAYNNAGVWRER